MKYIRTKDGIHEICVSDLDLNEETSIDIAGFRAKYCRGFERPITKDDVIKIADTIEELCDVFVYAKCDYMELEEAKREKDLEEADWQEDGLPIYGAIWTEKGLIYVAKMNEKRKLELL